jgi:hypothetical protein
MRLDFSLTLPDELSSELTSACRECECSPQQFAAQTLESALASRRLPRVTLGANGPRMATPEVEPDGYPVHLEVSSGY